MSRVALATETHSTTIIDNLYKLTNHPVHFQEEESWNPTALIPFCEFGKDMSVMGIKTDQFDVPLCNSFRPKVVMDQLCYQVDPNIYKDRIDLNGELSISLFIHYNEDRQFEESKYLDHSIIIDTIGQIKRNLGVINIVLYYSSLEIKVTEAILVKCPQGIHHNRFFYDIRCGR